VGRFADMDAEFDEFLKNFDSWQVHLLIASFSIFLLLSQTPHWHAMNHIQYELFELSQLLSRKDLAIGSSHGESTKHAIPWFLILCLHFGLIHPSSCSSIFPGLLAMVVLIED